tara:strand:+ start:1380 stop:1760 length:381 start_codon:yes stop_codon:yes gene_type:complete
MGQRVNIQYSVELEDLEEEVTRLFHNTGKKLTDITPCNFDYVSIDLGGIQMIDVLRQKLAGIDLTLRDIQNIIEGYVRFKTQPPPERESPFQQTSDELEVEQLEEQIAKFKETLSAQPNQEPEESN